MFFEGFSKALNVLKWCQSQTGIWFVFFSLFLVWKLQLFFPFPYVTWASVFPSNCSRTELHSHFDMYVLVCTTHLVKENKYIQIEIMDQKCSLHAMFLAVRCQENLCNISCHSLKLFGYLFFLTQPSDEEEIVDLMLKKICSLFGIRSDVNGGSGLTLNNTRNTLNNS